MSPVLPTLAAFTFSLVLTPLLRDLFRRVNVLDHPDQARKRHSRPVPRVGGIAVAMSYGAALLLMLWVPFTFGSATPDTLGIAGTVLPAAILIFAIGVIDDLIEVSAGVKLAIQIMAAGLAYWGGIRIRIFPVLSLQHWWNAPLTVIWLVWCTNAFNLIDGVDGLAAGVASLAALTMAAAALIHGRLDLVLVALPLVGSLLGFLRYNVNTASVFLGDSGSLFVGFVLACFGVLWSQGSATMLGVMAPLIAMTIPLLDVGLSVLRRFVRGKPILVADRGHVHHMLLDRGLSPRKVVLLIYLCCGVTGALSLLAYSSQGWFSVLILVMFIVGALTGVSQLGYVEFRITRQMFSTRTIQRIIDAQSRLAEFEKAMAESDSLERCWELLAACALDFAFVSTSWRVRGRTFTQAIGADGRDCCWQLRLPLHGRQYVNFERPFSADVSPLVIGEFVKVVERSLNGWLEMSEREPVPVLKETMVVMSRPQGALVEGERWTASV